MSMGGEGGVLMDVPGGLPGDFPDFGDCLRGIHDALGRSRDCLGPLGRLFVGFSADFLDFWPYVSSIFHRFSHTFYGKTPGKQMCKNTRVFALVAGD